MMKSQDDNHSDPLDVLRGRIQSPNFYGDEESYAALAEVETWRDALRAAQPWLVVASDTYPQHVEALTAVHEQVRAALARTEARDVSDDEFVYTTEKLPRWLCSWQQCEDLHHATRRMLQALDGYWEHCEGLSDQKLKTVRSFSTAEDWWNKFERYRARVEEALALAEARDE